MTSRGTHPESLNLFAVMFAAAVLVSLLWVVPGIVGQTVRIAGDSTMAKGGGGKGTDGKPSYTNL